MDEWIIRPCSLILNIKLECIKISTSPFATFYLGDGIEMVPSLATSIELELISQILLLCLNCPTFRGFPMKEETTMFYVNSSVAMNNIS